MRGYVASESGVFMVRVRAMLDANRREGCFGSAERSHSMGGGPPGLAHDLEFDVRVLHREFVHPLRVGVEEVDPSSMVDLFGTYRSSRSGLELVGCHRWAAASARIGHGIDQDGRSADRSRTTHHRTNP